MECYKQYFFENSYFILKPPINFYIPLHDGFVCFRIRSVFYFGNSSIMHSLRPRERINDLWVVTYPKKNTATHKTWTQTFSAKFRDIHMYMLVRLSHRCCLAQQSNGSKSCLHVWWPLCFLYITKKKALHFKEKEMISLRKAEFVTKWDETVLSNTNLNQP